MDQPTTSNTSSKFDLLNSRKTNNNAADNSQSLQQLQQQQLLQRLSDVSEHAENNEQREMTAYDDESGVYQQSQLLPQSKSAEMNFNNNNSNSNTLTGSQKVKFHTAESLHDANGGGNNRFKVSHLKQENSSADQYDSSGDEIHRFIDDDGRLVKAKHVQQAQHLTKQKSIKRETSGLSNSSKHLKVKYNREEKSIEFSINLGDPNTGGKGLFYDLKTIGFYQACFAEFFATFLLVLYVCSFGLPINDPSHIDMPASINGALGSGLVFASIVWAFAHVGGANLNPAVTIALFLTGESNLLRVLFYIPAQMLGSVMAAICLRELVPEHISYALNYKVQNSESVLATINNATQELKTVNVAVEPIPIGLTLLNSSITPSQGFGVELVITFILTIAIFASIDKRRTDLGGSFPLTLGFAVTLGSLFGGKFTGGSMNPARSFGPALIMENWENHWIYWAGPISGAIIAGYTYKLLMLGRKTAS